jgi:predicted dehydrogenase
VLFRYPDAVDLERRRPAATPARARRSAAARLRLGVVGAGNYASTMLLPHFARDSRVALVEVATRTPLSAANAQRRFPFERSSTDTKGLLAAPDVNAVLVATRHASHAELTAAALEAGHPVFVEKPLAVDRAGVERVRDAVVRTGNDRIHVGFNRRFSPLLGRLKAFFSPRAFPLVMTYRVHAGQLEQGSWYLDPGEGSRFLGEGGHFLDALAYLTGSSPVEVSACCLNRQSPTADDRDNVAATLVYADGSVGTVQYLTQGGSQVPKEQLEVFGGGKAAQLVNFGRLDLYSGDRHETVKATVDKGQRAQVEAFVEAVCGGGGMPIALECLFETTLATLAVDESLRRGGPVRLAEFWEPIAGLPAAAASEASASFP